MPSGRTLTATIVEPVAFVGPTAPDGTKNSHPRNPTGARKDAPGS